MDVKHRLGNCEVCDDAPAKYCCPRCELKTCSLVCVNIHKKELECDGKRYKTGFKHLDKFTDNDMSQDYRLINEFIEAIGEFKIKTQQISNLLPGFRKLRYQCLRRNIRLHIIPNSTMNKNNTSYVNGKNNKIFWRVDWIFHDTNIKFSDHKVPEYQRLNILARNYFTPEFHDEKNKEKLQFYLSAGIKDVMLLMKTPYGKYYELDSEESLLYNLRNKSILEYPEILVVLSVHKDTFSELLHFEKPMFHRKPMNKNCNLTSKCND
ncbi:box C/D snoRNA protein 1 [Daktulosphaira vitifoliae]|uniref:box C/D snoRNA protein 1 n=1 Tax=Daktulosphaira vitifoliae TaxID=58002 RepID=UPI0021AAC08B|nr:box C/D snoRNA protein 1 [Daktulosphaira vitifoliae]